MSNYASAQRGLFCLTSYHTIHTTEKKRDTYSSEEIMLPPNNSTNIKQGTVGYFKRKTGNYSLLHTDGIVRPRERFENGKFVGPATVVKKGDVIIGKVLKNSNKAGEDILTDISISIQTGEEGTIDKIHIVRTPDGFLLVKIVIRVLRVPTLGDKLASRSAQKGTIGMIVRHEDMPFTGDGIVPDIMINPLCMPSRMTIAQLVECALGKNCAITGDYGDVTPFTERSTNISDKLMAEMMERESEYRDKVSEHQRTRDKVSERQRTRNEISQLENKAQEAMFLYGFQHQGNEMMYNGMTGEAIEARIFIGPTYYQRLKHMVDDKMHARAKGTVTALTRQASAGRSRDGGQLRPQWYLNILLVRVTAGDIVKDRGTLVGSLTVIFWF